MADAITRADKVRTGPSLYNAAKMHYGLAKANALFDTAHINDIGEAEWFLNSGDTPGAFSILEQRVQFAAGGRASAVLKPPGIPLKQYDPNEDPVFSVEVSTVVDLWHAAFGRKWQRLIALDLMHADMAQRMLDNKLLEIKDFNGVRWVRPKEPTCK
jgi:hypothetical protein